MYIKSMNIKQGENAPTAQG